MNNFENTKSLLKAEINNLVLEMKVKQNEVTDLLKEIEEKKLIAMEIEEAIKKLSQDNV